MTTEPNGATAEQLAVALMAEARRLWNAYPGQVNPLADRLAQWASDVRQLGVQHFVRVSNLESGYDTTAGALRAAVDRMTKAERRLGLVREEVTKLEMARSDNPNMTAGPLLTVLSYFVEGIEGALDD